VVPDKYMEEWNNLLKKQMEKPLNELSLQHIHYAPLEFSFHARNEEKSGKKALELGAGDGVDAYFLAQLGYNITTIDLLQSSVDITKKRAKAVGLEDKVKAKLGDMKDFRVEPESYEVIAAIQCSQFLYDEAPAKLYELIEGVKPGGWLLYGGNIEPHLPTEPPPRFITIEELRNALKGCEIHTIVWTERLISPENKIGYVWIAAQKTNNSPKEK